MLVNRAMLTPVELILKKRDGGELSATEISSLIAGLSNEEVADYQVSAFLMATYFRGMSEAETVALTRAMLESGQTLKLASVRRPKIDKHSTGGVGDKISVCLAPLVAACGVAVPMISGRGLGHTGGTLDKLEAIPGFRVQLPARRFERLVQRLGTALIGQTRQLAPADRRLYALRDVTGTVESVPLIVASILSKKLAAGIDGLVLDVKVGRGAFMKDLASARTLARALVRVGQHFGKRVVALLTDMSTPIGLTIGNALETREAIEVLRGQGPLDTRELTLTLGAEMLLIAGVAESRAAARKVLTRALDDGSGYEIFLRLVRAQGGDVRAVEDTSRLPRSKTKRPVSSPSDGVVRDIDALELGLVGVALGAGRTRADLAVDPAAGIEICAPLGTRVRRGEPLAFLHARSPELCRAQLDRARQAFSVGARGRASSPRLLERITH